MGFDFDDIVERSGTSSTKHERYRERDVLPLWVADMDFRAPPAVIDALKRRIDHGVFGYTETPEELVELIIGRLERLYGWRIEADELVFLPGVVAGLNVACRAFSGPDDAIVTQTPIYPPFMSAPAFSQRRLIGVPGRYENGQWKVDFDALVSAARDGASLLLLCNPWNPVGRVLAREELGAIAAICHEHDLVICSDEIHCDLLFDGRHHVPTATLGGDVTDRCVTLMAPSKTFNLAGFGGSFAVIQNEDLRRLFVEQTRGIMPNVNIMAYAAMTAAYRDGNDWYRELMAYLEANRDFLTDAFASIPGIDMNHVEATYLAWLDVRELELDDPPAFFEAAGIGMSEGHRFGDDRFMRLNFGCSRRVLESAIERFDSAIRSRA